MPSTSSKRHQPKPMLNSVTRSSMTSGSKNGTTRFPTVVPNTTKPSVASSLPPSAGNCNVVSAQSAGNYKILRIAPTVSRLSDNVHCIGYYPTLNNSGDISVAACLRLLSGQFYCPLFISPLVLSDSNTHLLTPQSYCFFLIYARKKRKIIPKGARRSRFYKRL